MSSQYLLASITAIHGKQSTNSQTALPPYSPISLVCQTKCNVFLPHKNNSYGLYGESSYETLPPYNHSHIRRKTNTQSSKTNTQSRKTSHPSVSQSSKTSHPRTTRSSLFPPYNNSRSAIWRVLKGTLPPLGSRACACLGRQEDREDSRHTEQDRRHAGSSSPALPHAACLKCLPRLPALPVCPACPLPTLPVCVILSMRAPHAHPVKRPFVKPFYHFPICQNVTY